MAVDEALLEVATVHWTPLLRVYAWSEPAASFGYFQRYSDVAQWTTLRPLIRRPTGGGLVPHNRDWTYSVVIPPTHEWYALKAVQSYERIHQWLQRAFSKLGVETRLAPFASKEAPGQCFVGAEQSDLLWKGRKIAGAAQRRNRQGLLIQGSVQCPVELDRSSWEHAMQSTESAEWRVFESSSLFRGRVEELAATKYSQDGYNRRR